MTIEMRIILEAVLVVLLVVYLVRYFRNHVWQGILDNEVITKVYYRGNVIFTSVCTIADPEQIVKHRIRAWEELKEHKRTKKDNERIRQQMFEALQKSKKDQRTVIIYGKPAHGQSRAVKITKKTIIHEIPTK